jgi:2-methylcitrate dehydratase PrpD
MTKSFHAGNAARNGIVAAKLARRGFTAASDIIEARYGFADCFGGEKCLLPAVTQSLGQVFLITAMPPDIKMWPCCSSNHRPLTAVLDFVNKHPINVDDIERIEHYGFIQPGTGSLQKRTDIKNGFEAKFSLEYNIAAAFLDKKVDLSTFNDERVRRDDIQSFIKRIQRYLDPEVALHSSRTKGALNTSRILVFMKDGTVHELPVGLRTVLKGAAVLDKFRSNAAEVLRPDASERVISMVMNLEKMSDVRELVDAITIGGVHSKKLRSPAKKRKGPLVTMMN